MEKEKLLTLTSLGEIGGDCTGPMYFKLARECTVRELCDYIITNKEEWGCIRIQTQHPGFDLSRTKSEIEYFHGEYTNYHRQKILFDLVDEVANAIVTKVDAHGGWSNVDYILTVKRGPKVEAKTKEDKLLDMQSKLDYLTEKNQALVILLRECSINAKNNCNSCTNQEAVVHWQAVHIIYKDIIKMIEDEDFFNAKLMEYIKKNTGTAEEVTKAMKEWHAIISHFNDITRPSEEDKKHGFAKED